MSGIINKAREMLNPNDNTTTHTTGSTAPGTAAHGSSNVGPHDSNLANKADPRVDSDRDHRAAPGTTGTTTNVTTGSAYGGSTTAGPHRSDLANKLDPRVDSDLDGNSAAGAHQTQAHTGAGLTGGTQHSTNAGPHSSNLANKADPRVDSDRDHRGGYGSTTAGTTGTGYGGSSTGPTGAGYGSTGTTGTGYGTATSGPGSSTAGPHSSNLANKADPRVDSDLDNRGAYGSSTTGTSGTTGTSYGTTSIGQGPAPNTAGPHKSDLMNKLDPRVDSDRDGSKTYGGNATQSGVNEPLDAAKHRPSQFQAERGDPTVEHGNPQHSLAGRHGAGRRGSVNEAYGNYGSGVN